MNATTVELVAAVAVATGMGLELGRVAMRGLAYGLFDLGRAGWGRAVVWRERRKIAKGFAAMGRGQGWQGQQ